MPELWKRFSLFPFICCSTVSSNLFFTLIGSLFNIYAVGSLNIYFVVTIQSTLSPVRICLPPYLDRECRAERAEGEIEWCMYCRGASKNRSKAFFLFEFCYILVGWYLPYSLSLFSTLQSEEADLKVWNFFRK